MTTALIWDEVGDRRFETGVDRGVLYLPDGGAVPWNGLTQITENTEREVKSYYIDGIKYLDHHVPGAYSGTLQAFTYPDELDELTGVSQFAPGVFVHDQRTKLFSLAYRTRVGNDLDGTDHAYKIHLLYNVLAVPGNTSFSTLSDNVAPEAFSWTLYGTPSSMFGIRPTSHISIHSDTIDSDLLEIIEKRLYGSPDFAPLLPGLVDLLSLVEDPT